MKLCEKNLEILFKQAIAKIDPEFSTWEKLFIQKASNEKFGDYQTNFAMTSAKEFQQAPRKTAEQRIATELNSKYGEKIDSKHVIITTFTIKSVRRQSGEDEGSIIVFSEGIKRRFDDESTLFRSINKEEQDQFVEVYAPFRFTDETDKKRKRQELDEVVREVLTDVVLQKRKTKSGRGET